ncbi:MAG: hypothetical protein IPJ50_15370 [Betaproteobacteria bacterium]|nr:hypothetical protein [Betaproteobacteria bacterium]
MNHQEPSTGPTSSKPAFSPVKFARKKTSPVSLNTWLQECKANDQVPIPEDSPVFAFAEKAGISLSFWKSPGANLKSGMPMVQNVRRTGAKHF